ncbi:unnamed protein product [Prorocentrum cordatum]|uniref:Uncharacterized protein n=1 Tax=Prorocentrum cordatum TaxID=2364126 RepID=A0ABN9SK92_9DINO|nr:unnamed protein product [Polarella glacialis]
MMKGHALHGPAEEDEEECLLPKKPGVKKLGEEKKDQRRGPPLRRRAAMPATSPGSAPGERHAADMGADGELLHMWSLPQPTLRGKLATFGELWYLDRLHQEKRQLEAARSQLDAVKSESGRPAPLRA